MKLFTATTLALSLCVGTVLPVAAENIVGTVKAWQYMQADGWKSADGLDNHTLSNALYGARVIDNYPWTRHSCYIRDTMEAIFWPIKILKRYANWRSKQPVVLPPI